ncbi:hypothetical protein LTR67_009178 [Exophiala xenobiotica]
MSFLKLDDRRIWFDTTSIDSVMEGAPETEFDFTRPKAEQERVPSNKRTFRMAFRGSPYTTELSTAKRVVVDLPRRDDANITLSLKTPLLTTLGSEATSISKSTTLKGCLRKGKTLGSKTRTFPDEPRKHVRFVGGASLSSQIDW